MEVHVDTPFKSCEKCKFFKLETEELWADNTKVRIYECEFSQICLNAVGIVVGEVKNGRLELK